MCSSSLHSLHSLLRLPHCCVRSTCTRKWTCSCFAQSHWNWINAVHCMIHVLGPQCVINRRIPWARHFLRRINAKQRRKKTTKGRKWACAWHTKSRRMHQTFQIGNQFDLYALSRGSPSMRYLGFRQMVINKMISMKFAFEAENPNPLSTTQTRDEKIFSIYSLFSVDSINTASSK